MNPQLDPITIEARPAHAIVPAARQFAEEDLMPRMTVDLATARARLDELRAFIREMMVEEIDYGKLPGMQSFTLYKPGAEKLLEIYGFAAQPRVVEKIILGPNHPDNPFSPHGPFYSWDYAVDIYSKRTGNLIGTGVGSCNSMESKYRWRDAQRTCPICKATALIYGKPEYAKKLKGKKHWLCFPRKGGCGEEFDVQEPRIVEQEIGKVPNDDVYSLMNTIQKMAKKRALIDGAISVTRSSGMFIPEPGDGDDDDDRDTRGKGNGTGGAGSGGRSHKTMLKGQPLYTAGVEGPTILALDAAIPAFEAEQGEGKAQEVLRETFGVEHPYDLREVAARDFLSLLRAGAQKSAGSQPTGRRAKAASSADSGAPAASNADDSDLSMFDS